MRHINWSPRNLVLSIRWMSTKARQDQLKIHPNIKKKKKKIRFSCMFGFQMWVGAHIKFRRSRKEKQKERDRGLDLCDPRNTNCQRIIVLEQNNMKLTH